MRQYIHLILLILFLSQNTCKSQQKNYTDLVKLLKDKISNQTGKFYHAAYQRLAFLSDTYGPRMWGSDTLQMAIHELYKMAVQQSFQNIRLEAVKNFTKWVRGNQQLILHNPRPQPTRLNLIGLGTSVPGHVKAEAFVVSSFQDLQLNKEKAKGKIIVFNAAWTNYDDTVQYRGYGATYAAKFGGIAALVRSVTPISLSSVHTGVQYYDQNIRKIPVAAITVEDAEMLARMQDRNQKIVLELIMENKLHPYTYSNNLVFEIRGTEKPEQIILMGGHIDSWDTGSQTGANDDGGGFVSCFQAMRILLKNGLRPKRTLRFIAWSGQQWGDNRNGAIAYLRAHKNELQNHILAFQDDQGSTKLQGFGYSGGKEGQNLVKMILSTYLTELNASTFNDSGYGVDTDPLNQIGIPIMRNLVEDTQDAQGYFTYHHSAGDSMTIMDPDELDSNVIGIAAMLYILADLDKSIPKPIIDMEKLQQFLDNMRK